MGLFPRITCYPPLGQITCPSKAENAVDSEDHRLRFTVIVETDLNGSVATEQWETQIWHNIHNSEWSPFPLRECHPSLAPLLAGSDLKGSHHRQVYSEEISLPDQGGYAQFTVRFRTSPEEDWQWANQLHPVGDGELVITPRGFEFNTHDLLEMSTDSARKEFGKYIENLSSDVDVESRASQAPGSLLWHLSGKVDAAPAEKSIFKDITLGTPSSTVKFFSLVRGWAPWLAPRHGRKKFKVTEDAILCSFLRTDGVHLVLLALSGIRDVLTAFGSGGNGELVIKARSDNKNASQSQVLASVAQNFEVAMSAVIYEARKLVTSYAADFPAPVPAPTSPTDGDFVIVEKDPKAQWLSEWYDGLTYCTWNALGQDLTEDKILRALDDLKANGIKISTLIIDDNWQSLDGEGDPAFSRRWKQFEANPVAFPHGLRHTVEQIRQSHPNIEHIAVWHALFGYWGGISPNGDLAKNYKTKEVKIKDPTRGGPIAQAFERGSLLAIDPDDVERFYDDFYNFLASARVDSVKTDAQFFLDLLESSDDRRRIITSYQDAWSIASLKHFSTRAISCMSQIPQAIFHSQLPANKPTIPLRNSDDFFPDIPASHPWHVFCNAHNSLLTRFLNVLPDWDMFQTSHPYASFHAAARCVSGGPIYITDEPGKHDLAVLNQITAPTTHGATVILRPSVVGRTVDVYQDYNEGHILRVGTYNGWAVTGTGILGLFNIQSEKASCIVALADFSGIDTSGDSEYIVRAHTTSKITDAMKPSDKSSLVSVTLEARGWEILTAYPIKSFKLKRNASGKSGGHSPTRVAVLGLIGKMTGTAALASTDTFLLETGRLRCDVNLKALGTLGIYISDLELRNIDQNFMVMISGRTVPRKTVWKEGGGNSKVLAVDVLAAWKAMGLNSGWSNEITVQVFVD